MRFYAWLVYFFLYMPIAVIVAFSFNYGRYAADFQGFSVAWYGRALANPFVTKALVNSLIVASVTAVLSVILGTTAALALERLRGKTRAVFDSLIYVAIMVPGVVIGIATLVALASVFDAVNSLLASMWPAAWGSAPRAGLGYGSIIAAHTLYTLSLVILVVRSRLIGMDHSLVEASADLYSTPFNTFRTITLPQLLPAIAAGFLLSFTFSFDDFIIAFFVAGPNTTLPIFVFSSIRRGVTPEINAIGTMILAVSLILLFTVQILLRDKRRGNAAVA
jgi:spermidine/putrescine transport system permease protein